MLKKLPIMLNIMPMTTAIMLQFIQIYCFNNYNSIGRLQTVMLQFLPIMLGCSAHIFTYYARQKSLPHFVIGYCLITI